MKKSIFINGVKVFAFNDRKQLLDFLEGKKIILIAINSEKILKEDPKLKQIINQNLGYTDGMGAVMAMRQKGFQVSKIPGAELWLDIVKKFHHEKTFYLLGSTQDIIDKTVKKLKSEYPNINIVGYRNGYLKEDEKEELFNELQKKKPDIVFIAQGSPRQEFLMDELMQVYPALYMGLGGSFDVYTGFKKRAPKFFLDLNLEWLYRLLKEPTRISRQIQLVKFVYLFMMKKL